MRYPHNLLNRYFWTANIFFWLASHFLFTSVQYRALLGTPNELTWMVAWVKLSPWFINWIWVTAAAFIVVENTPNHFHKFYHKVIYHLAWMLGLLSTYWLLATFLRALIEDNVHAYWDSVVSVLMNSAQLDVFIYIFVLALAMGAKFYHSSMEEKLELRRLQHALSVEQLKTLRSQLNPHFLFNALNTIASLVRLKRESEAVTALSELSQMLRTILENKNSEDVKIRDEIAFINCYLSLQKMRFAEKLDARVSVADDCLELPIPNMLLHPLVENAVQHGSQLESNRNLLDLQIRREGNDLNITLTNKVAKHDNHEGFGIGLTNTRARLARLYKDFSFELKPVEDDLFVTSLAIPIGERDA